MALLSNKTSVGQSFSELQQFQHFKRLCIVLSAGGAVSDDDHDYHSRGDRNDTALVQGHARNRGARGRYRHRHVHRPGMYLVYTWYIIIYILHIFQGITIFSEGMIPRHACQLFESTLEVRNVFCTFDFPNIIDNRGLTARSQFSTISFSLVGIFFKTLWNPFFTYLHAYNLKTSLESIEVIRSRC